MVSLGFLYVPITLIQKINSDGQIESFENRGGQNFNHIKINFIIEA